MPLATGSHTTVKSLLLNPTIPMPTRVAAKTACPTLAIRIRLSSATLAVARDEVTSPTTIFIRKFRVAFHDPHLQCRALAFTPELSRRRVAKLRRNELFQVLWSICATCCILSHAFQQHCRTPLYRTHKPTRCSSLSRQSP